MNSRHQPLIGVTPGLTTDSFDHGTFDRYVIARTYTDAVRAAGGIPIILCSGETDIEALVERVDGVLLSGGGDVAPHRYGDEALHLETYGVDDERDRFELALVRTARERDLPLLGICRGIQVFNVALGGTLIQHIDDDPAPTICHRQHERGLSRDDTSHDVTIADNANPLRGLLGDAALAVNSFHHQAIREVAPDLETIATAPDGIVEAVFCPAMRFGLAVQWHPEMLALTHRAHLALFIALIEAARSPVTVASR